MANGKRFYWLKLPEDFFNDKTIKKLRRIAGGDTYTIIYLKMLLKAMKNEGKLYIDGIEDSAADEIALDIDEDTDNVLITINYLKTTGLLLESDDNVYLPQAEELTGSETQTAERVRKHREKIKALHCNTDVTNGNALVTNCNTEIEIEKEKDIEIEIDNKQYSKEYCMSSEKSNDDELFDISNNVFASATIKIDGTSNTKSKKQIISDVIDAWNKMAFRCGLQQQKRISVDGKTGKNVCTRINEYGMDGYMSVLEEIQHSDFLLGRTRNPFTNCNLAWVMRPNNFEKIYNGNYSGVRNSSASALNLMGYENEKKERRWE